MHTTQKYKDGSYYTGEVNKKNQRHGFGTMTWGKDEYFTGTFKNGLPVFGKYYYPMGIWTGGSVWIG